MYASGHLPVLAHPLLYPEGAHIKKYEMATSGNEDGVVIYGYLNKVPAIRSNRMAGICIVCQSSDQSSLQVPAVVKSVSRCCSSTSRPRAPSSWAPVSRRQRPRRRRRRRRPLQPAHIPDGAPGQTLATMVTLCLLQARPATPSAVPTRPA